MVDGKRCRKSKFLGFISVLMGTVAMPASALCATYQYCIPVDQFDFNPFRRITEGKQLAYLSATVRSYISPIGSEESLLESFSFSPDGKIFTGRLRAGLHWPKAKGTNESVVVQVTPLEAAYGIARGLQFRPLGERLEVRGAANLSKRGWSQNSQVGVRQVDERTFTLEFSKIPENATGVLREALSSGSMHNRLWPVRLNKKTLLPPERPRAEDLLAHADMALNRSGAPVLHLSPDQIVFVNPKSCNKFDLTYYPDYDALERAGGVSQYDLFKPNVDRAIIAVLNPLRHPTAEGRQALAAWLRLEIAKLPLAYGFRQTASFFEGGEPGFGSNVDWNTLKVETPTRPLIGIADVPTSVMMMQWVSRRTGVPIEMKSIEAMKDGDFDFQLLSSKVAAGRVVFLQDLLKWNSLQNFVNKRPELKKVFDDIAAVSASTIPPQNELLQRFERIAKTEAVIVPVGRRKGYTFTRKGIPVELYMDDFGDHRFRRRTLH